MGPLFFVLMDNDTLKENILRLARPLVQAQGLEIWGLDVQGTPCQLVRLYVDIPLSPTVPADDSGTAGRLPPDFARLENEGWLADPALSASIDQCEEISRSLGLALEVEDYFPGAWTLEVSTPGLERKFYCLEQMVPYIGDIVEVRLGEPLPEHPGRKVYRGALLAVADGGYTLKLCSVGDKGVILPENTEPVRIDWDNTRHARRIHIFDAPAKPGKSSRKKS